MGKESKDPTEAFRVIRNWELKRGRSRSGSGNVPKNGQFFRREDALAIIVSDVTSRSHVLKTFEVSVMLLLIFPTYSDVVNIGNGALKLFLFDNVGYGSLETGLTIGHAKRNASELVESITSLESSVRFVTIFDSDLVVGTAQINSAKQLDIRQ